MEYFWVEDSVLYTVVVYFGSNVYLPEIGYLIVKIDYYNAMPGFACGMEIVALSSDPLLCLLP